MLRKIKSSYQAAYSGLPRTAWLLALVVFINRSGSMVMFFLTLYLTRALHFSLPLAGLMLAAYGAGSLAGSLLGGWLTDVIGTRRVQLYSLLGSGSGLVLLSFLHRPLALAAVLFLLALVTDAFRPANAAAIASACPAALRPRAYALNRLAINLGVSIGPAVGGYLATLDYRAIFWADGATCLAAAFLLLALAAHFDSGAETPVSGGAAAVSTTPWRDRLFVDFTFFIFISGLIFTQVSTTWPVHLREIGNLREDTIGLLVSLNAVIIVCLEMPLIHRLEREKPAGIMAIGALLLACGFGLLAFGTSVPYVAFTVVVWTLGEILLYPLAMSFVANRASDENRGKYIGFFTLTHGLGGSIGPSLGSLAYARMGATPFWLLIGALGLPLWYGIRRIAGRQAADTASPD